MDVRIYNVVFNLDSPDVDVSWDLSSTTEEGLSTFILTMDKDDYALIIDSLHKVFHHILVSFVIDGMLYTCVGGTCENSIDRYFTECVLDLESEYPFLPEDICGMIVKQSSGYDREYTYECYLLSNQEALGMVTYFVKAIYVDGTKLPVSFTFDRGCVNEHYI